MAAIDLYVRICVALFAHGHVLRSLVVDETDFARFQLHLCRLNNEDPLGLDAAHAVHDVLRRRPAIHELLSEALGGSSCNRRAKLSSR